ncbi:MAG: hypothetical protein MUP13_05290 [Thermoanaerobaculales bacterium]|nr:hypothetical protein [Thermoanaerobaculales bacterium]
MRTARCLVILGLAALVVVSATGQDGEDEAKMLFIASDDQGTVWANVGLALQNRDDAYIPMVVGVQNNSPNEIKLTRESFHLADMDGVVYSMPTVKEWRKGYKRIVIDRRLLSTGGIPWEVWYQSGRLARSNFFPDLSGTRGNTTISTINLRTGFGMVDLMYFEQLRVQQTDRPFILTVQPVGWEVPINLRLYLN